MARVAELSCRTAGGEWQNQLHSPERAPGIFVWFNPWYGGLHPGLSAGGDRYPGRLAGEQFAWQEAERTGSQGIAWRGVTLSTRTTAAQASGLKATAGLRLDVSYLTAGESNVLAVPFRLVNESGARLEGAFVLHSFLQPGGDRARAVLHYERNGLRTHKRVHGGLWGSSDRWVAVSGPDGAPALTLVAGTRAGQIAELRDMGLEGAHPVVRFPLRLAPDEALEGVAYVVLADDAAQARLYRFLADAEGLV
jgi:hypothetical protein